MAFAPSMLVRQLARQSSRSLALGQSISRLPASSACPACCSPSTSRPLYDVQLQSRSQQHHNQQLRFASKKKHSKGKKSSKAANHDEDAEDEIEVEDHPVPVLAKGKKAKAAQVTPEDAIEAFNLEKLEKSMDDAVERFQVDSRSVIGRVDRLSPALLDSVRVFEHGQRFPLQNYATVSVSGAEALIVNLFDPAFAKPVEKAIRDKTDLNFNPQKTDDTTLRIPVPRPDLATRSALAKKASDLAEAARVAIRAMRHQGQKDLKTDQDNKVIGTADARKDGQKLQDATKKRTDEVDKILAKAKKILLDE
ncbi:ribosome recycling factor [Cystobasidium minutum MCA 4210]|uniref:ribosome recycling factor n=1 Tax=Cystobasidium minutum MCA 4210 TaxID=1397322 RepID=UPI0034CD5484|eukprot:jgi/Rhomi1/192697/gm1.911_g